MGNTGKFCVIAIVMLCSGILQYATLTRGHDWGDDFSCYLMQAKSIADGNAARFIEENRFTVERSSRPFGPAAAPWGLPVLLAPLYGLFGLNILALKSLNLACYLLFLVSLAFFLRGRHSFPFLVLFVSFFAFNPMLLASLDSILSDVPFLLLSTLCIFLIGRTTVEGRPLLGAAAGNLVLGALLAAAFFMRTNGFVLVLALLGTHIVRIVQTVGVGRGGANRGGGSARALVSDILRADGKRIAAGVIPYATFAAVTMALNAAFPQGGSSHVHSFGSLSAATILHNVRFYGEIPSDLYFGIPHHHVWYVVSLPFLFAGMAATIRRDYHVMLYMLFTAVLYLLWPFTQGMRYIYPLLPFYIHFTFVGIQRGYGALDGSRRAGARALAVVAISIGAAFFVKDSASHAVGNLRAHRAAPDGPYTERSREMFDFIRTGTGKDAVIVFFKPRLMRMLTDRSSIMIDDPSEVGRGDYLCFHVMTKPFDQVSLGDVVRLAGEGRLVQVFANPEFRVYRIVHSVGRA